MPPKGKGLLTGAAQKQEGRALKRAHRQVGLLKGEKGAKRLAKQDLKQARLRAKKDKVTAVTEDENASYPEKAAAWAALQALNLAEDEEDDVDDHFNAWLVGKGRDIDHARTPWKRTPLLHNVGVIEHLKMFTDDRWNFIEELNGVWWDVQQGDASVDVLFNYYRFFVRGNLDPESLDNVDYMKFFREMKEGIPEKLKPDTRFVQQGTIDTLNNWALGRGTARSGFVDLDAAEQARVGLRQAEQTLLKIEKGLVSGNKEEFDKARDFLQRTEEQMLAETPSQEIERFDQQIKDIQDTDIKQLLQQEQVHLLIGANAEAIRRDKEELEALAQEQQNVAMSDQMGGIIAGFAPERDPAAMRDEGEEAIEAEEAEAKTDVPPLMRRLLESIRSKVDTAVSIAAEKKKVPKEGEDVVPQEVDPDKAKRDLAETQGRIAQMEALTSLVERLEKGDILTEHEKEMFPKDMARKKETKRLRDEAAEAAIRSAQGDPLRNRANLAHAEHRLELARFRQKRRAPFMNTDETAKMAREVENIEALRDLGKDLIRVETISGLGPDARRFVAERTDRDFSQSGDVEDLRDSLTLDVLGHIEKYLHRSLRGDDAASNAGYSFGTGDKVSLNAFLYHMVGQVDTLKKAAVGGMGAPGTTPALRKILGLLSDRSKELLTIHEGGDPNAHGRVAASHFQLEEGVRQAIFNQSETARRGTQQDVDEDVEALRAQSQSTLRSLHPEDIRAFTQTALELQKTLQERPRMLESAMDAPRPAREKPSIFRQFRKQSF